MSFSETIFLFFLALIIFGPKKLPEIARQVGKALNEFRRASNEFKAQIEQEISNLEVEKRQTILPPSHPPEGVTSRALYSAPGHSAPAEAPATLAAPTAPNDEPITAASGPIPVATEAVAPAASTAFTPDAITSSPASSPSASPANDVSSPAAQESNV